MRWGCGDPGFHPGLFSTAPSGSQPLPEIVSGSLRERAFAWVSFGGALRGLGAVLGWCQPPCEERVHAWDGLVTGTGKPFKSIDTQID